MNVEGGSEEAAAQSDSELMQDLIEGKAGAMKAIYERYEGPLRAVILAVLHEPFETEDVLHEVLVQLWKKADCYLPEKGLRGFLVTMARRRALDRVRRKLAYRRATDRLETQLRTEFHDRIRTAAVAFTDVDLAELLASLIRQLPEAQQEVVRLTFYEGLSQREIACRKGVPLGTVKTRLYLAQRKLLNRLVAAGEKI